jgi:DNA-binding MarR family transcriptional regulator
MLDLALGRILTDIEPRCLRTYLFLLSRTDVRQSGFAPVNGGQELPLGSIARALGKTPRAVGRNIRELELAGFVSRESEPSRPNVYHVRCLV